MSENISLEDFSIGSQSIKYDLIFVLGTSRAGKSLLCRFLNSTGRYEWIHEPYAFQMNTIAYDLCNDGERNIYKNIAIGSLKETINDRILLRNANFRPGEVTSVYNHLNSDDVFYRLHSLRTRDDVDEYVSERDITFLIDLPDLLWHIPTIKKFFPDAKIIHVVRNGNAVAHDVAQKGWYSLERMNERKDNCIFYLSYGDCYLPWWLPKEYRKIFMCGNNNLRSYLYWISSLSNSNEKYIDEMIKYEQFTATGEKYLKGKSLFADIKPTAKSYEILEDIRLFCLENKQNNIFTGNELSDEIIKIFNGLMRRYGYE